MSVATNSAYASPSYVKSPTTGDRLAVLSSAAVRALWKKGCDVFETTNDFFAEMEGSNAMSIIHTETDTSKGAGQSITFTIKSGLYADPHHGDALFEDSSHFEELRIGTNSLTVDWLRHGVRFTERSEEYMGMRGELVGGVPNDLGEWAGRLKTEMMFMNFRERTPSANLVGINGALLFNDIIKNAQMLKRNGGPAAIAGRLKDGKPLRRYIVIACTDALTSLKLDSNYQGALKTTRSEPEAKMLFSGGFTDVDGHVIKEYEALEHDGYGSIGSPLNPMGRLGVALTIASANYGAVKKITLGGNDLDVNAAYIKTSKWFGNYPFQFLANDTMARGTTAFWVAIVNPPNAAVDANKYGIYKCGYNDGTGFYIEDALVDGSTVAAHASGGGTTMTITMQPKLSTSIAGPLPDGTTATLAWDATKHSNTHAVDSLVVAVCPDGTPQFKSLILGAGAARRGYGKYRNERESQNKEGTFVRDVYFKTVFGQSIRTNRQGRAPSVLVLTHKGQLAGTPLPTP